MKNIIAAGFLIATLFSCKKTETTTITSNKDSAKVEEVKFSIDSVKLSDSVKISKSLTANFKTSVSVSPKFEK
ncbi:hypothetical protein [Halpernia sp. GG3]